MKYLILLFTLFSTPVYALGESQYVIRITESLNGDYSTTTYVDTQSSQNGNLGFYRFSTIGAAQAEVLRCAMEHNIPVWFGKSPGNYFNGGNYDSFYDASFHTNEVVDHVEIFNPTYNYPEGTIHHVIGDKYQLQGVEAWTGKWKTLKTTAQQIGLNLSNQMATNALGAFCYSFVQKKPIKVNQGIPMQGYTYNYTGP